MSEYVSMVIGYAVSSTYLLEMRRRRRAKRRQFFHTSHANHPDFSSWGPSGRGSVRAGVAFEKITVIPAVLVDENQDFCQPSSLPVAREVKNPLKYQRR